MAVLLDQHEEPLLRFIKRLLGTKSSDIDPQDVLQEVYFYVLSNPDRFEAPKFENAFLFWLKRIARNRIWNLIKKKRERGLDNLVTESGTLRVESKGRTASSTFAQKERRMRLFAALETLPDAQRSVLWLRNYEDLSFEQIAERTGKASANSAAQFYYRAVEKLAEAYEAHSKGK